MQQTLGLGSASFCTQDLEEVSHAGSALPGPLPSPDVDRRRPALGPSCRLISMGGGSSSKRGLSARLVAALLPHHTQGDIPSAVPLPLGACVLGRDLAPSLGAPALCCQEDVGRWVR